jgi:predicted nucleic acid-binding protein
MAGGVDAQRLRAAHRLRVRVVSGLRVPKIYLETTIFNYYFDEDRGEAHTATVELFREIANGQFEPYTSVYAVQELLKTEDDGKRENMIALIEKYGIIVLSENDEAVQLANVYVDEGVVPAKYRTDGIHIATASVNELDIIASMNFTHIVKRKTKLMTPVINALRGYRAVEIYTPMEVIDNEPEKQD